ncbi:MAG TPA: ABC transporter permease [Polyangiaceae bacterium]|jgi:ABC-2 type transport system permease protein
MPSAWLVVARREYSEGIRSKLFLLTCVLGPVFLAAIIGFSVWAQLRGGGKVARLVLVDETQEAIGKDVAAELEAGKLGESQRFVVELAPAGADRSGLARRIEAGSLDGYLVLPDDVSAGGLAVYRGTNASSNVDMAILEHSLRTAIVHVRARALGLTAAQATALLAPVSFEARQPSADGGEVTGGAAFAVAYVISFLLYMSILLYGVTVMRSVVLEKSSRVMEVIVSCARPWDLMLGKVVGNGMLGLTQLGVWTGLAVVVSAFKAPILARFAGAGAASIVVPSIGAGQLACIVAFFLGGYFLYSSIFAAIGAANDSERDAQQAQMPVMMVLIVASMCFPIISGAPRDPLAVVLTTIPFFSPVLMPMRILITPVPAWEIALSLVTLLATIAVALWCAARIFRVGILMYGKRSTLGELVRWVRQG